jgi:hypothetical protein
MPVVKGGLLIPLVGRMNRVGVEITAKRLTLYRLNGGIAEKQRLGY